MINNNITSNDCYFTRNLLIFINNFHKCKDLICNAYEIVNKKKANKIFIIKIKMLFEIIKKVNLT